MARPKPTTFDKQRVAADNRRAKFDYHIEDTYEAGLALQGTEVKALRAGEASIKESYAEVRDGQVWLINATFPNIRMATASTTNRAVRANCCCIRGKSNACSARSSARA